MFGRKKEKAVISYDKDKQYPIIRASICTGEKVAGFKDIDGGHFTEVMLIRDEADLQKFKNTYGIEDIRTEY